MGADGALAFSRGFPTSEKHLRDAFAGLGGGAVYQDMSPAFKSVTTSGYTVNVVAAMNGMDALRIEYAPKGGDFRTVGFFTNARNSVHITPTKPGEPETGHLRAI